MENIGKLLKQRREELGLSIEDVCDRTRLTTKHIKAIEEGDISYFRDDLSYLRFFLRSYCEILSLDFNDIKDELRLSIDDYTTSFTIKAENQHRAIEKNVRENATKLSNPNKAIVSNVSKKENKLKTNKKRSHRRIDFSLISFILIIGVIIIGLIAAFVMLMNDKQEEAPAQPPVAQEQPKNPTPEVTPKPEEKEPEKEVLPFAITKVSDTEYTLDNLKDGDTISFEVYFGSHSQLRVLANNQNVSDPATQIYKYGQTITFEQSASANKVISLGFGYMQNNKIKINGIDVDISSNINTNKSATLNFTVKGE